MIDEVTRNRSFHQQTNMRAYGIGKFPPRSRKESGSFISFVCWLSGNSLSCLLRRINSFAKTPSSLDRPIRVKKTVDDICLTRESWLWWWHLTLMMTSAQDIDIFWGIRSTGRSNQYILLHVTPGFKLFIIVLKMFVNVTLLFLGHETYRFLCILAIEIQLSIFLPLLSFQGRILMFKICLR